jgi:hypothetical protein
MWPTSTAGLRQRLKAIAASWLMEQVLAPRFNVAPMSP